MATNTSQGSAASLFAIAFSAASALPEATWDQEYEPVLSEITGYSPALQAFVGKFRFAVSEVRKIRRASRPAPTSLTR